MTWCKKACWTFFALCFALLNALVYDNVSWCFDLCEIHEAASLKVAHHWWTEPLIHSVPTLHVVLAMHLWACQDQSLIARMALVRISLA